MDENVKKNFICVYRTPKQSEIAVIQSLLDAANIPYFIENEAFALSFGSADGVVNFGVMVEEKHLEEARELLGDFITPKAEKKGIPWHKPLTTKKYRRKKNLGKAILIVGLLGVLGWVLREFSYEMAIPQEDRKIIREYKERLKLSAKDNEALEYLGYLYFSRGQYKKAVYYYKKAVEIGPDMYSNYSGLGSAYIAMKSFEKAVPVLEKSIVLNPKDELSYVNLGKAYNGMWKYSLAIPQFLKALELNPANSSAYNGLSFSYYYLRKYNKVLESAKKEIEAVPQEYYGYYNAGLALLEMGFFKEAISFFEKAINIKPQYAEAHYNLGLIYKKENNMELMQQQYKKLKELRRHDLANRLLDDEKAELHFDLTHF